MIGKVWVIGRRRGGRKRHYALRWREPIFDERGQPTYDAEGQVRYRVLTESAKTTDRSTAKALAAKKFRELNGVEPEKASEAKTTLDELAEIDVQWLENRLRSQGTVYLTRLALRHLQAVIGNGTPVAANSIAPRDVECFITARRAKVSPKAVNRELGNLCATFGRGVKVHGLLKTNPFAGVEKLRLAPKPINALTRDEEAKLLAASAHDLELEAYVRLALDTGCRAGELSNLRVKDLDLDSGLGRIECNADWKSKTGRDRPIAFTLRTVEVLRRWLMKRDCKPHVFKEEGDNARGHYKRIARRFKTVVAHAGIGRNVTLHDLRRTVGSLLAERGVNQRVAMEFLGHSNITTTAKFYQAVRPETLKAVVVNLRPTGTDNAQIS